MKKSFGRGCVALSIAVHVCAGPVASADAVSVIEGRGKPFWLALATDCAVPAGESPAALVNDAVSRLGSRDSQWRDDVGYGVVAACVYKKRLLTPPERRTLITTLTGNLRKGIGEIGTDTVLLRSFSALDLSLLAALELQDPVLDDAGYRRLLDDPFSYLRDERDLRGLEPDVGWVHATAHTADLLKFLARDKRFTPADQNRLLEAAWARMTARGMPVWTHAEEERIAAALMSVIRRPDFAVTGLDAWLAQFGALEKRVWEQAPPDAAMLDASQNARNLLRSLFVLASMPQPEPTAGQESARQRVLVTLQGIRR